MDGGLGLALGFLPHWAKWRFVSSALSFSPAGGLSPHCRSSWNGDGGHQRQDPGLKEGFQVSKLELELKLTPEGGTSMAHMLLRLRLTSHDRVLGWRVSPPLGPGISGAIQACFQHDGHS